MKYCNVFAINNPASFICSVFSNINSQREVTLQTMLMKTLLKVATKYKTILLASAFPSAFLDPLLKMSMVTDAGIRKIVQEILHTLIDRHDNKQKLRMVR